MTLACALLFLLVSPNRGELADPTAGGKPSRRIEVFSRCSGEAWQEAVGALVKEGDPAAIPLLLQGLRERPRLRGWAIGEIVAMGPAGDSAFRALGTEGVDLLVATPLAPRGSIELLRGMGTQATQRLIELLQDSDAGVRTRAVLYLRDLASAEELEPLMIAAKEHGDPRVRMEAARGIARIDPEKAVSVLISLLHDPATRGVASDLVAIDDDRALEAWTAILNDPTESRAFRWDLAQQMERRGSARAAEVAKRYGPSGTRGSGNPDSPAGARLTGALLALSLMLLVVGRRCQGVSLLRRLAVVSGATFGSYIGGALLVPAWLAWVMGAGMSSGRVHAYFAVRVAMVGLACVVPTLSAWALCHALKARGISAALVGAASGLALVGGILLDQRIYWYLLRTESFYGWTSSLLVLTLTFSAGLLASYWPRGLVSRSKGE